MKKQVFPTKLPPKNEQIELVRKIFLENWIWENLNITRLENLHKILHKNQLSQVFIRMTKFFFFFLRYLDMKNYKKVSIFINLSSFVKFVKYWSKHLVSDKNILNFYGYRKLG